MRRENDYWYALKITLKFIKKYPSYWFWFALRLVYVASTIIAPILFGLIIDGLGVAEIDKSQIYIFCLIYLGLIFIGPAIEVSTASQGSNKIANKVSKDFRDYSFKLLENAPQSFFKKRSKGQIAKVIDSAYANIFSITDKLTHFYLTTIFQAIGIFIGAVFFDPFLILIFSFNIFALIINLKYVGAKEKREGLKYYKNEEKVNGKLTEYLNNFRTITYLNLFPKQFKNFKDETEKSAIFHWSKIKIAMWKWFGHAQLTRLTYIVVFIYALVKVLNGNLTVGILVIIVTFTNNLTGYIGTILGYTEGYIVQSNAMRRYRDVFSELENYKNKKTDLLKDKFEKINFKNVSIKRRGEENLKGVSFDINQGEKIAIIGNTGGGKSSVLDIILKVIPNYEGNVSINKINYKNLNVKDLVDIFAIVPQEVQLFKESVKKNILPTRRSVSAKELNKVIKVCELENLISKMPKGINQKIEEGSINISGGERQRIGIARALLQNNPVLILDEATASLDPKTERVVIENIIREYPQITLIYVTHKYSLLNHFDKILLFKEGNLVGEDNFKKLKTNNSFFNELYEASKIK